MTYEQEGVYRRLLDHQWMEGSIPADPQVLASLLPKMARERFVEMVWPHISAKFQPRGTGRLVNDKLETQRRERDRYIRTQKANIRKRWNNKKIQPAAKDTTVLPSNYSSSSTSTSTKNTKTSPAENVPDVVRGTTPPAEKVPSGIREFLGWFQGEYKARRNGATYFVRWDAHSAIVKRLLTTFPADRLKKHAQILLKTDEDWTAGTDRGIEILSARINWLEERLCQWEAQRKAREAV
mgnify:CR=1 FL=1